MFFQISIWGFSLSIFDVLIFLQIFHSIEIIRTSIIFLDAKYVPSIKEYDNIYSNYMVLGSNSGVVILIQWHYMCAFPAILSSNVMNKDNI